MLQAAHSGKWPKDAEAVRRLKAAWLIEVGAALDKKLDGTIRHRMLGENLIVVTANKDFALR